MKHIVLAVLIALNPLLALATAPVDGGNKPLLMKGKRSLYQRVLATPDAQLADEPGGQGHTAVVPFTSYYVYARREHGGTQWIEVGTDRHGTLAEARPRMRMAASTIGPRAARPASASAQAQRPVAMVQFR